MHRLFNNSNYLIGLLITFLLFAIGWEVFVSRLACWWWMELFLRRPQFSTWEALLNILMVFGITFIALPHFFWLPVTLFKELRYVVREWRKHWPYEAKPYMVRC